MTRTPWIAAVGLVVGVAGGIDACTYQDEETELARIDDPVSARLVLTERGAVQVVCSEDPVDLCWPGSVHEDVLRLDVDASPPFSIHLPSRLREYNAALLDADEAGERLAYRIGRGPWRLVFPGSLGRGYVFGKTWSAPGGGVDWDEAPSFQEAAVRLYARGRVADRRLLMQEIEQAYGTQGQIEFMLATLDVWPRGEDVRERDGVWGEAYRALPRRARKQLRRELRQRFLRSDLGREALTRTVRYLDFDRADVLDRIELILATPRNRFATRAVSRAVLVRALTKHRPQAAARYACAMIADQDPDALARGGANAGTHEREAMLLAIIAGRATCPIVRDAAAEHGLATSDERAAAITRRAAKQRPDAALSTPGHREISDRRMRLLLGAAARAGD